MFNEPVQQMPEPVDPTMDQEAMEEQRETMLANIHAFASRLSRLAQDQVAKKAELEQRWLSDLRQYHGEYEAGDLEKMKQAGGSQVFVNITRNKTHAFSARLQDMLFPTDDRSWAIQPTPVPAAARQAGEVAPTPDPMSPPDTFPGAQGGPQSLDDPSAAPIPPNKIDPVDAASEAMQEEIDDQLKESRYQTIARDAIDDASILGTGILKGPNIVGRINRKWTTLANGMSVLSIEESLAPGVARVSPWDFYPDMDASTPDEAEFFFERHGRMSKRQLRDFAKLPGVLVDEVRDLMKGDAADTHVSSNHMSDIRAITGVSSVTDNRGYEIWEYHGPISKQELCECMDASGSPLEDEDIDELNDEVSATVFFAGNRVLKVALNPMDTEDQPYSVFCCEKDSSCIFGFGVPYLMRNPQRVMNAAWRMMMDNAGMSVADQVVMNRDIIQPADGNWKITPKKQWYLTDKTRSVQEAFATFNTPSHQAELANIFGLARQLADEETNLPLIAQGEQTSNQTQTSTGMAMLMNSANIVLRRSVKNWDDDITRPLITRFYDWNMQFNPKPGIKGDFQVDARGSGALLVREKQQQNLMMYANLSAGNAELAMRRDWAGLDKEIAKSLEVPYEQITLSDEELEAAQAQMAEQGQPQDPMVQAKLAELEVRKMGIEADLQDAREKRQMEYEITVGRLNQDRELRMMELATKENITMAELQARLQIKGMDDRTKRESAAARAAVERGRLQMQGQNLAQGYDTF